MYAFSFRNSRGNMALTRVRRLFSSSEVTAFRLNARGVTSAKEGNFSFISPSCLRYFSSSSRIMDFQFKNKTKLMWLTAGSCVFLGLAFRSRASCRSIKYSTEVVSRIPTLKLYQYQTCPFCCKARAYLDYAGFQYEVVEVNPLTRKEMKFSKYRKVPFIVSADGVQVNDSSLLISVLQSSLVKGGNEGFAELLNLYPEVTTTDKDGKTVKERHNMYFIMYGEKMEGQDLAEIREEREWRKWVDDKLVHAIPPNIYRTLWESLQAFRYISKVGNFGTVERVGAKYVGAVSMYLLSKRLKKKYHLKPDVRQSLYDYCNKWLKAVGKDRKFMGGNEPNLADLAVYGVLSSIDGLPTFHDIITHTNIGEWYFPMKKVVQARRKELESQQT